MAKEFFLAIFLLIGSGSSAQYKHPVYPQGYFRWPTALKPDIVANMGELRPNHWHMGLDVRTDGKVNQNVYAAADGYISFVGIEPLSWGRWIIITHPNGISTLYGHLNNFRPDLEAYVTKQQYKNESWVTHLNIASNLFPVKKGDFIAYSGSTGGSQGPHVHWEFIDTKTDKRLNPSLFGQPIADNVPPAVVKIGMYNAAISLFDGSPQWFKLVKTGNQYTIPQGTIYTDLSKISFALQAYDTRSGTHNQDGIYSAELFMDEALVSSFYIDSVDYDDTRYVNAQIDYKLKYNGGPFVQRLIPLPGDRNGVYHPQGILNPILLSDTLTHAIEIVVKDANGNTSTIGFSIRNNGEAVLPELSYDWFPNRLNRIFKYDFEAYLPQTALYDKMNSNYSRQPSAATNSVSAVHSIGAGYIPVHSNFEVRIKPDRPIPAAYRNRIVMKRTGRNSTVKKAEWNGEWLAARFRDFGSFQAFIDNVPPGVNSLGNGDIVNLSRASRISFTPTDNFGIADFRAELDGEWLRFTNDKGHTWTYYFDDHVTPGEHTLSVTVTDIAGNTTTRSWRFIKYGTAPVPAKEIHVNSLKESDAEETAAEPAPVSKTVITKKTITKERAGKEVKPARKKNEKPAVQETKKGKTRKEVSVVKKNGAKTSNKKAEAGKTDKKHPVKKVTGDEPSKVKKKKGVKKEK